MSQDRLLLCIAVLTLIQSIYSTPWDQYILAPSSRTVLPVKVISTHGLIQNPENIIKGQPTTFQGQGSYIIIDFGKEVGGIITLHVSKTVINQRIGLAFSESKNYASTMSDASNGGPGPDGAIFASIDGPTEWTMPIEKLRGGFRYLTLFLDTDGPIDIDHVSLYFTASPNMQDLRKYPNYFYCSDTLLNRIWYAGAYTVQLNTIKPDQGRVWGPPPSGWKNNAIVGVGSSVIVDGAKRDRTIWPGDMGISIATVFVSTNDLESIRNSIDTLYKYQKSNGELPFAGPEVNFYNSDTYHMWGLLGTYYYYSYSHDKVWLNHTWSQYKNALSYITKKINNRGLLNVTNLNDWARMNQGGENIEANALMYHVLETAVIMANDINDTSIIDRYKKLSLLLKLSVNQNLWDTSIGMYKDNPTSTLYPQDGNALAVQFNLINSNEQAMSISNRLRKNWNQFGSTTPEKNGAIGTFPGSMEVHAHFKAKNAQRALDLIRLQWGYMLNHNQSTNSTFWEGYLSNGQYDYQGTYMSHAHGWATGPTSALTFYIVGLQMTSVGGQTWSFIPYTCDLRHAQGQITTPIGIIRSSWFIDDNIHYFNATVETPKESKGKIGIPHYGKKVQIIMNGEIVWNGTNGNKYQSYEMDDHIYLENVTGGTYIIYSLKQDHNY